MAINKGGTAGLRLSFYGWAFFVSKGTENAL